jgi:phosphoglucosamine mutase
VGRLFGTDGVRGLANRDLTAEIAVDLSVAAAHVLGEAGAFTGHRPGERPVAVVGRDPRASGEFLEAAVIAGLASAGVDVLRLGVLPTPAVAYLTAALAADLGVMISASHNAMPDNGLKFLARGGHKLDDAAEDAIEARLREPWERPTGAAVGRVHLPGDAGQRYVEHVLSTVEHRLDGLTVLLDCANGAAHQVAPAAFEAAGASVLTIHDTPDGYNINDGCGSTHLGDLQAAVVRAKADAGFAFDGDADRCLAVDAEGEVVDGDQILAILARAMRDRGQLADGTVVATVMSNLGFVQGLERLGIGVQQTAVGDRYILEAMKSGGYTLGGEQSGHVIMAAYATTGDGLLAALHVAEQMALTGSSVAQLASVMTRLPQVLVNVSGVDRAAVRDHGEVAAAVTAAEKELQGVGRILLRPSGTEPLVRVMVEAPTSEQAQQVADHLAGVVRTHLSR